MEIPIELIVKGKGEGVIIDQKGSIKYSVESKIVPVDCKGNDLVKK